MPARAAGLDSLPDDLLGACLGLLSQEEGYSITLVCKRFRRLFYEQPGPWRRFEVELIRSPKPDAYPAAKLAVLRQVAPHVQEFVVCGDYGERSWDRPPASFLRLLPSSLVALEVRLDGAVPPAAAQLLHRLPDLRSLCLQGYRLPKDLPEALQCLTQLEQLEIGVEECFDPDRVMAAIAQLGSLTQLLVFTEGSARLRPPAPAAFPRLEAFKFYSVCQWTPAKLAGVLFGSCFLGPAQFGGEPLTCFALSGVEDCESLAAFLDAAVPPSANLQALSLSSVELSAAALQGCTRLNALQLLELSACNFDEATAAALLASTPRLTSLHLAGTLRSELPGLAALLSQPLPELHTLRLSEYRHSLPSQLAQLTNLRRLEWLSKYGKPSAKETKLLARLPRLTTLVLGVILKGDFAKVTKALEERLPGVRVEPPPDSDSDDEYSSEE